MSHAGTIIGIPGLSIERVKRSRGDAVTKCYQSSLDFPSAKRNKLP